MPTFVAALDGKGLEPEAQTEQTHTEYLHSKSLTFHLDTCKLVCLKVSNLGTAGQKQNKKRMVSNRECKTL